MTGRLIVTRGYICYLDEGVYLQILTYFPT
jgi:hypothetical protein